MSAQPRHREVESDLVAVPCGRSRKARFGACRFPLRPCREPSGKCHSGLRRTPSSRGIADSRVAQVGKVGQMPHERCKLSFENGSVGRASSRPGPAGWVR
jgi:hypothetical protein